MLSRLWDAVSRFARRVHKSSTLYGSLGDSMRAVALRVCAEPCARRLLSRPVVYRVRLRGLPRPFWIRRGTTDFLVLRDIFEDHECGEVRLFNLAARPAIVDLGGNIGLSVRYFQHLWPNARVVVVEPDGQNFAMLQRNCAPSIGRGQCLAFRAFIAARDGAAAIDRTGGAWGFRMRRADPPAHPPAASASPPADGELIPCLRMETLINSAALREIDLLKVDIEGTERELFDHCAPWIGRVRHIAVEIHPPYQPDMLLDALRRSGWRYKSVREHRLYDKPRLYLSRID